MLVEFDLARGTPTVLVRERAAPLARGGGLGWVNLYREVMQRKVLSIFNIFTKL